MTVNAVRDRSKTVTRRHVDTWKTLKPGDRLTLIEKGMGLAKGEHQVVLADVEIVDVRVESLTEIWCEAPGTDLAMLREGITTMSPNRFAYWWAESHGYGRLATPTQLDEIDCRRIEWVYL